MTTATAIKTNPFTAATARATSADWQMDAGRMMARHVSGLVVSWQVQGRGAARRPALDIAGIQKIASGPWAARIDELVRQAIVLLEAR